MLTNNYNEKIILLIIIFIFHKINFGQNFFKKKIKTSIGNNSTVSIDMKYISDPPYHFNRYDSGENDIINNYYNNTLIIETNTTPTFNLPKFGYYLNKTKVPKGVYLNPYYEVELKFYKYFLSLKKMTKNRNSSLIEKERKTIFENISENIGMNILMV